MKRILLICLAALWLLPSVALAHSKLEEALPAQDATVTVLPERIELTYNTKIEKLSNFKLINAAGGEIEKDKVEVDGMKMTGGIPDTLPNGIYTVKWVIIGADGHSVEGDYAFTLDAPVVTEAPSPEPTATAETATPSPSPSSETAPSADAGSDNNPSAAAGDDTNYTPAIIIGAIIVVAALVLLMRRRK